MFYDDAANTILIISMKINAYIPLIFSRTLASDKLTLFTIVLFEGMFLFLHNRHEFPCVFTGEGDVVLSHNTCIYYLFCL